MDKNNNDFFANVKHDFNLFMERRKQKNKGTPDILKPVLFFGVAVVVMVVFGIIYNTSLKQQPNEMTMTTNVTTGNQSFSQIKEKTNEQVSSIDNTSKNTADIKTVKLNEKATAGKFDFVASEVKTVTEIKSSYTDLKTDNQFVIIKIKITNNDVDPRDVSTNMFKLKDSAGRTFEHIEQTFSVEGDEILFYETINPSLSRTRLLVFETPKDAKGFKLDCNSGVLLAGGEHVLIDLGI